MDIKVRD